MLTNETFRDNFDESQSWRSRYTHDIGRNDGYTDNAEGRWEWEAGRNEGMGGREKREKGMC